jgi:hypothetical protein
VAIEFRHLVEARKLMNRPADPLPDAKFSKAGNSRFVPMVGHLPVTTNARHRAVAVASVCRELPPACHFVTLKSEGNQMRTMIVVGSLLALAACTPNPGVNATEGAVGGAAVGCGIGAAATAPLLGVGCIPGAIIGGAAGTGTGLASTTPPPAPSTAYVPPPAGPPVAAAPPPPPPPAY